MERAFGPWRERIYGEKAKDSLRYRLTTLADEVAHFFALGGEVTLVGGFGGDLGGDALDDFDSCEFEGFHLCGVVGDEADGIHVELFQDLSRELEVAAVGFVT
jgi:hypothetical protein